MTVDLKLDAHAVRALIGDNENFRLELQSAVVQEIVRKAFDKSFPAAVAQMVEKHHAAAREGLVQALSDDVKASRAVEAAMNGLTVRVQQRVHPYMATRELSNEVKEMINRHVSALITEQVDKRVADLDKIIGTMVDRIEQRAEQKMEARLEHFDAAYHNICVDAVAKKFARFAKK